MLLSRPFQNTSNDEFSVAVKLLLLRSDIGQFKDSRILADQYLRSRPRYTREFEILKSHFSLQKRTKEFSVQTTPEKFENETITGGSKA